MSFDHHITSKARITPDDWSALCKAMVERADGFTFGDLSKELGLPASTIARRVYSIEERHGVMRKLTSRAGMSHYHTFKLTGHGRNVAEAIAFRTPMPGRKSYQQPKLTKTEADYLELRKTFKLPTPIDDHSSTVATAVKRS